MIHQSCQARSAVESFQSGGTGRELDALVEFDIRLMDNSRIKLPPLLIESGHRHQRLAEPTTRRPSVSRQRSWGNVHHRSRSPRKTYSINTVQDMETYNGHVRTPADAIILFEACRLGLLPRVQRRLSEKERQSIKSGSVFVWDEREAGMRRWTDGKSWSASRVSGSFLTYREMEGKRGGGGSGFPPPMGALSKAGRTPESARGSDSDLETVGEEGPDGYRYKPDGLMKQSFSITTSSGNHLHLISYYSRSNPPNPQLNVPTSDPALRHIRPHKGMYPESTVHEHQNIPAVTRSPMAGAPYSAVPQMAGYARQGPPQWSQPPNGFGWPHGNPSHSQQPQYYGYGYSPGNAQYSGGPPPPHSGHSPLQYSQSAPHTVSAQPLDPNLSAYDNRRGPPNMAPADPNSLAYDAGRHRPRSSDSRPPPPPPHHQQDPHGNGPREPSNQVQWDPRGLSSQAKVAHNNTINPPAQYQPRQKSSNDAMQPQYRNPSPHITYSAPPIHQPQSVYPANPSSTPIDPRLMGSSSVPHSNDPSRSSTPAIKSEIMGKATQSLVNGNSHSSNIPSIGALMNGSSPEAFKSGPGNGSAEAQSDVSGGRSPNGTKKDGPQDIPSDKVGFGEDMRALKVLDKNFNNAVKTN